MSILPVTNIKTKTGGGMSEKLIIENKTEKTMEQALEYAQSVVHQGRISNYGKQYCYVTTFRDGVVVCSFLNKQSDRLVIYQEEQ